MSSQPDLQEKNTITTKFFSNVKSALYSCCSKIQLFRQYCKQGYTDRREFLELKKLNESMLKDIGMTHYDVVRVCQFLRFKKASQDA